jgi:hypothetical protein
LQVGLRPTSPLSRDISTPQLLWYLSAASQVFETPPDIDSSMEVLDLDRGLPAREPVSGLAQARERIEGENPGPGVRRRKRVVREVVDRFAEPLRQGGQRWFLQELAGGMDGSELRHERPGQQPQ